MAKSTVRPSLRPLATTAGARKGNRRLFEAAPSMQQGCVSHCSASTPHVCAPRRTTPRTTRATRTTGTVSRRSASASPSRGASRRSRGYVARDATLALLEPGCRRHAHARDGANSSSRAALCHCALCACSPLPAQTDPKFLRNQRFAKKWNKTGRGSDE
jgi:hypothetical protein